MKRKRLFFIAPLALVGMVVFLAIGGELVMHLWNWLMPDLFGLREITFWQALGLLGLSRILFGGSGWRGRSCSHACHRVKERRVQMTPEQRERFREGIGAHLGFGTTVDETKEL